MIAPEKFPDSAKDNGIERIIAQARYAIRKAVITQNDL